MCAYKTRIYMNIMNTWILDALLFDMMTIFSIYFFPSFIILLVWFISLSLSLLLLLLFSPQIIYSTIINRPSPFAPPPHLFPSLFATPRGRSLLREVVNLEILCSVVTGEELDNLERRAALWALAHIAVLPKALDILNVGWVNEWMNKNWLIKRNTYLMSTQYHYSSSRF